MKRLFIRTVDRFADCIEWLFENADRFHWILLGIICFCYGVYSVSFVIFLTLFLILIGELYDKFQDQLAREDSEDDSSET